MKKSLMLSAILLNVILIPSLCGMLNVAKKIHSCKVQQRKCTLKKNDENFNRSIMGTHGEMMSPWQVLDKVYSYDQEAVRLEDKIDLTRELLIKALCAHYMCDKMLSIELDNRPSYRLSFIEQIKCFFSKEGFSRHRLVKHDEFMDNWMQSRIGIDSDHNTMKSNIYRDMDGWDPKKTEKCKKQLAYAIIVLRQRNAYFENIKLKDANPNTNNE